MACQFQLRPFRPHRLDREQGLTHVVRALQDDVDESGIDRHPGIAREIEQGFDLVRELLDAGEVQKSGQSFDGVKSAKDGVDRLRISRIVLEREQLSFDAGKMFSGFHDEVCYQFGILIEHQGNSGSRRRRLRLDELLQSGNDIAKLRRGGRSDGGGFRHGGHLSRFRLPADLIQHGNQRPDPFR